MNDKIKKFATQAGLQPYYDEQSVAIEKFAKLLINDCCSTFVGYINNQEIDCINIVVDDIKMGFSLDEKI